MDREFPSALFPSFYHSGPPDTGLRHCAGSWGTYGQLKLQRSSLAHSFKPQSEVHGEAWRSTELLPLPLHAPTNSLLSLPEPPNPLDFNHHLNNFFWDHHHDAFSTMSQIIGEKFYLERRPFERARTPQDSINKITSFMDVLKYKTCPKTYTSPNMDAYCCLLSDAVHSIPLELLASLLHEELSLQSQHSMFCEANTGGALDFIPFTNGTEEIPQSGCLVYPANGVDKLHFQKVKLQPDAVVCSNDSHSFLLKGPIRQISSSVTCGHSCVGVRSPYHCGVWSLTTTEGPRLLQTVSTTEESTCINVSPHVVGEVLVASESGAAHLWTLGRGMQQFRTEDSNLYFNSRSPWRWCEFSAHPRVMLYADRTGVELTDIRAQPNSYHTLFRIGRAAECRTGERLLTCRYLSEVHSFHHLISTQYSAYIMDERFPCVPMLKVDHLMEAPPIFCHILTGHAPSTKVLLGSQSSQEMTLLQYSEACVRHGPLQALLRPKDSLQLLPAQIPHRTEASWERLGFPATGLTSIQLKESASGEGFCIFQLLETGDIFYQLLEKDLYLSEAQTRTSNCASGADTERPAADSPESNPEAAYVTSNQMKPQLSEKALSIWKQWLQKLVKKNDNVNKSKHANVTVKNRFQIFKSKSYDSARVRRLQGDLKKSMSERSLPVGSTEKIEPLSDHVQADTWSDELSTRLTMSWDSEAAWHAWWAEHLGVNKGEKTEALRRKRRKEKEARRASGRSLLALSSSFTSSISYQSELSDWAWSDSGGDPLTDTSQKQLLISTAPGTERYPEEEVPTNGNSAQHHHSEPEEMRTDAPVSIETLTPGPSTPVKPRPLTPRHQSTPTTQRWREMDASQVVLPSQQSIFSSVLHKAGDLSQDTFSWSQTPSQSTQGRTSQPSQPKKRSRMGF